MVEKNLTLGIQGLNGLCYKFVSPGRRNVPDRLCLLPGGVVFFVEVKRPGKTPTKGQLREAERITAVGAPVFVVDSIGEVRNLLKFLETQMEIATGGNPKEEA